VTNNCGCIRVGAEGDHEPKGTVCVWSHLTALTRGDVAHPMLTRWFWYTLLVVPNRDAQILDAGGNEMLLRLMVVGCQRGFVLCRRFGA
jgi:hypothetical protein